MFFLFRCNKGGIPYSLIKFHDLLVEDTVKYFEKGKEVRKGIREARKALKKALKIAKKKKRNPGVMIGRALSVLKGFSNEIEYTRKALRVTYDNMENALKQIEEERIQEPITLIESGRELFIKKDFENGIKLVKQSKEKLGEKVLLKTRIALFGGISNEVKDLKRDIENLRKSNRRFFISPLSGHHEVFGIPICAKRTARFSGQILNRLRRLGRLYRKGSLRARTS